MTKAYHGKHTVVYEGKWEDGKRMHGEWNIEGYGGKGMFELTKQEGVVVAPTPVQQKPDEKKGNTVRVRRGRG